MELVLLGTGGGGWLRQNRRGMAHLVITAGEPLLFDCGEGTTRQLLEAGIHPAEVKYLFFTHHHFDHNADYAYFGLSTWVGRHQNLRVYGPAGTAHVTECLFGKEGAFKQDLAARTELAGSLALMEARSGPGQAGKAQSWIEIDVSEIESSGLVCQADDWTVTAALTDHVQPYMDTLAYRVDSGQQSIAIAADSAPTQSVIDLAKGADILVHECSATEDFIERFGLKRAHTGPVGAARVALEADVGKLVLVHFLVDVEDPETLQRMAEYASSVFGREVIIGEDLMRIVV